MNTRTQYGVFLVCLAVPMLAGCGRNIVRAASPSVASPPPSAPRPTASSTTPAPEPIPPPELPQPAPELAPSPGVAAAAPQPPRPRPAAPVVAETAPPPKPSPEVAPPQISPILTPADQERLTRVSTDQIRTAERNLQLAAGRRLNPVQNDLAEKVRGFLSQAHEAVTANDWVRAQNLAEKAQVLSAELVKSF